MSLKAGIPRSGLMQQYYLDLMNDGVDSAWKQVDEWTKPPEG